LSDAQQQAFQNHLGNKATLEGTFEAQKSSLQGSSGVQQVKDQTANTSETVRVADGIRTENTREIENSGVTAKGLGAFSGINRQNVNTSNIPVPTMPKP
jgi:hypothetical protein